MLPPLDALFTLLGRTFRLANLVEIIFVSAFFYLLITWLQQSVTRRASRNALVAVLLFASVYVLARVLDLYFIVLFIERGLIVFLLMAVVIFQQEIRRMIDRIGRWRFTEAAAPEPSAAVINVLTEAAARMAENRIGALIALRGQEAWDHEIEGGVPLDGVVSLPLLYSLFNPDTPGHDGAVLVERDRVVRFSAHLPLSASIPEVSRFGGTRHAAATGLSEACDALVIVVSEERGTISVAQGGRLTPMQAPGELRMRLEQFWERHYSAAEQGQAGWWRRRNVGAAALSAALAVLLWFTFTNQGDTVYRTYTIPVELRNLAPTWQLVDPVPAEARVTVAGSEQAFRLLDPTSLVVSFDVAALEPGVNAFTISEDDLRLPSNLRLYDATPNVLEIHARPQKAVRLPVRVETKGSLPDSLELVSLAAVPDSVTLMVPAEVDVPRHVHTEDVDLAALQRSGALRRRLLPIPGTRLSANQEQTVTVRAEVRVRGSGSR